jgi:hypothetical protein
MFLTTTFLYAFWILSSKVQILDTDGFLLQDATLDTSLAEQGIAGTGSDLRHHLLCYTFKKNFGDVYACIIGLKCSVLVV